MPFPEIVMPRRWFACCLIGLSVVFVPTASAHYNMLLPQSAFARRGREVALLYQWGHPFEHQLFQAPRPEKLLVIAPNGQRTELTDKLAPITVAGEGGKPVTAYRLRFTPKTRGDYIFLLHTPPIWMADEQTFFRDVVKVILHVQIQRGWDQPAGQGFEIVPLTRPYGLRAGAVYQAQVRANGKPVAGTLVEIEHYNEQPPPRLPPDEYITRTAHADPNGVLTTSLPEAGWWALTAQRPGGQQMHEGKMYPVLERTTLWIPVAAKFEMK